MNNLKRRILCVDDSRVILLGNKQNLEPYGFDIDIAQGGQQCLKYLKKIKPDCILLDYEMPDMNGTELCQIIKYDSDIKDIPIIMLTGNDSKNYLLKAIESGADDFISKTVDIEILVSKINSIIRLGDLIKKQLELERFRTAHAMVTTYNHELRNPLTIALGMLGKNFDELNEERFLKVQKALWRISEIITKLDKKSSPDLAFKDYLSKSELIDIE